MVMLLYIKNAGGFSCGAGSVSRKGSVPRFQEDKFDCEEGRGGKRVGGSVAEEDEELAKFRFQDRLAWPTSTVWQRIDSYRCDSSDCVSMDDPFFDATNTGSSAAG